MFEPTVTTSLADYDKLRENNVRSSKYIVQLEAFAYRFLGIDPRAQDAPDRLAEALGKHRMGSFGPRSPGY